MDVTAAKLILSRARKLESRDHAFGDVEITWVEPSNNENEVAWGYFSGRSREVSFPTGNTFIGSEADILRDCFIAEEVGRNDETGPDEFVVGATMPGLTLEGVREELTRTDKSVDEDRIAWLKDLKEKYLAKKELSGDS